MTPGRDLVPLKSLPLNTEGRDFVIGDLHGMYVLFETFLQKINFDPKKDRIISVGDLVDRGPYSHKCLSLLRQPWFHAVLSNHEDMMYYAFQPHNDKIAELWVVNGGLWGIESVFCATNKERIPSDDQADIIDLVQNHVAQLPLVINLETEDGYIHVIHAELPPGIHVTDKELTNPNDVKRLYDLGIERKYGTSSILWGRHRFDDFYNYHINDSTFDRLMRKLAYDNVKSLIGSSESPIISGHTIVPRPVIIDNFINIDTGAFKSADSRYGLTAYDVKNESFITVRCDSIDYNVTPFTLETSSL